MKKFLLFFILILSIRTGYTAGIDSLYFKANVAYTNQYYANAIDLYRQIIDLGYESADVYYNLGNACFKNNDFPSAILYFEKARKLEPNNDDILFNLQIANTKIIDKIEPVPELFLKVWWRSFFNIFTADIWAKFSVTGFILFFVLLAFYLLSKILVIRKIAFYSGLGLLLMTMITFGIAWSKYSTAKNLNEAIVFSPTITVKSSPSPNSVDLFVIHEGSKVKILDHVGEWYEIRIASGSIGWLPTEALKKI
jgi:tetratricopeptide (TPR) repeat protein